MPKTGSTVTLRTKLTDPDSGAPKDPIADTLSLELVKPTGAVVNFAEGDVSHDGVGLFSKQVIGDVTGLWHYRWLVDGSAADEGDFEMESDFVPGGDPDLTDLFVLVPRARRKVEGPWGNPNDRPALMDSQLYAMVADACSEVVMLSGSFFHHELVVKSRDPLRGFPTEWQTSEVLSEYEAAIVCAQVALNYYHYLFRDQKISETIKNEGTEWSYSLSANVIKGYLEALIKERDDAIAGLRINTPVLDRFASNIRVRDQATVAVLEWWDTNAPALGGGMPGGQEASVVPWFAGG